jgi:DnaJ family protein A protein 5
VVNPSTGYELSILLQLRLLKNEPSDDTLSAAIRHRKAADSPYKKAMKDHYEVLNVPRDADAATIKKAHRKLALQYHPDKNQCDDVAAETFRMVQEAYECLSDPVERKWYDEHREAILRGWSVNGDSQDDVHILFDVVPFMNAGCYSGYGDGEGGFFCVYQTVFSRIFQVEEGGWVSEGNIDVMPLVDLLPTDFGNSYSDWTLVGNFYTSWESFSSCLAFAWADKYDSKDADHRRIRRAMEDENKKARRTAKRQYNEDILALVHFCKRRDPRVKAYKARIEREKAAKQEQERMDVLHKKKLTQQAKEEWRQQAEEHMAQLEEEDRVAGRIRLADLADDYDYGGGKKGRKGKKKKQVLQYNQTEEAEDQEEPKDQQEEGYLDEVDRMPDESVDDEEADLEVNHEDATYESESVEDEEEPDVWRCECCRKDFKSPNQMENHMNSKKHKENFKKWQSKQKKEERESIEDVLEELAFEP